MWTLEWDTANEKYVSIFTVTTSWCNKQLGSTINAFSTAVFYWCWNAPHRFDYGNLYTISENQLDQTPVIMYWICEAMLLLNATKAIMHMIYVEMSICKTVNKAKCKHFWLFLTRLNWWRSNGKVLYFQ